MDNSLKGKIEVSICTDKVAGEHTAYRTFSCYKAAGLYCTPGVITKYAISDEQGLLAILRYNRLIDLFTGLVCYSLQNHLRTTVEGIGQIETDELYIGIDKRGAHFAIPVQAKGGKDIIGIVQIEQDFALCAAKFPNLICKPIAAQFMTGGIIAVFEFEKTEDGIRVSAEKHYRLVEPNDLSDSEFDSLWAEGCLKAY